MKSSNDKNFKLNFKENKRSSENFHDELKVKFLTEILTIFPSLHLLNFTILPSKHIILNVNNFRKNTF